jgi:hypothetical protein
MKLWTARSAPLALTLSLLAAMAAAQSDGSRSEPQQITLDAQGGGDRAQFAANPNVRAFYELSVRSLRRRHGRIDIDKYERAAYAIFRELGRSIGASPEGMVEHLKGIPREIATIVERDPATLDSYENFLTALMGPP